GGQISASSTYGAGTTFRVTIPKGSSHVPAERIAARRVEVPSAAPAFVEEALRWLPDEEPSAPAAPVRSDARILIADDNADMRASLRRILGARWLGEAVSNGEAAFEVARRRPPDLVVSDVMMPVVDGFGLIAKLRADPITKGVPVILVSARAGQEARVEG